MSRPLTKGWGKDCTYSIYRVGKPVVIWFLNGHKCFRLLLSLPLATLEVFADAWQRAKSCAVLGRQPIGPAR
jgi:hypothetical protein